MKRKLAFILILLVGLGGFAYFVLSRAGKTPANVLNLPDGSVFKVGKVEYTNGLFSFGGNKLVGWRAQVAKVLPPSWPVRFGWEEFGGSFMFGHDAGRNLCVFTVYKGKPNPQFNKLRLVVFDEQGNNFDAAGWPQGVLNSSVTTNELRADGWCAAAFPRRGKLLGLRYYERGKEDGPCLAEFIIPNPVEGKYPVWTAESLPLTKTNGDLSVTLTSLKSGVGKKDHQKPAATNQIALTEAAFRLVQSGHETNAWRPKSVEIWDATGNHWTPYANSVSTRSEDAMDYFSFEGALWPGEAAWKMRYEFSRIADYQPDEVFTFNNIIVPGGTQVIQLGDTTNLASCALQLIAITGEKAEQPGNLKWSTVKNRTNISIREKPFQEGYRLALLKVTDDTGREAKIARDADWIREEYVYGFKPPEGAKRLNFTFAFHKSRYVEFQVKPEFVRAN